MRRQCVLCLQSASGLPRQEKKPRSSRTRSRTQARGFKAVGRDFPVFLHPQTHEEYALARTERKTARGYHGFDFYTAPDVTLEQDLARRDLTINAIARDTDGTLIDPFDGAADLKAGVLRHVGPAFVEDPVRILRTARFAARFGFAIAPETQALMRQMVANGEADALVPERVWQEISRGLMADKPSRMFAALRACGALAKVLPEIDVLFSSATPTGNQAMQAIDVAASRAMPLEVRFALLAAYLGDEANPQQKPARAEAMCERLRVPNDCRDLARLAVRERSTVERMTTLDARAVAELFERTDALRKPERFARLLDVYCCNALARSGSEYPHGAALLAALAAARAVDAGAIAAKYRDTAAIRVAVHEARTVAVAAALVRREE